MKNLRSYAHPCFALLLLVVPSVLQGHNLYICKSSDTNSPVTGSFNFTVSGGIPTTTVAVAVGTCATLANIGAVTVTVTEVAVPDVTITNIGVSANVTGTIDMNAGSVTVTVPEDSATVYFTNASANGRWTGGGSINPTTMRVTHGFELHCSTNALPNNIEINWADNRFHLDALTSVTCGVAADACSNGLAVPFISGTGVGSLNGTGGATLSFRFSDAGEPGANDFASYLVNGGTALNASGCLDSGNHQYHPTH